MKKTMWSKILDYINSIPDNGEFTRKEILSHCYENESYRKDDCTTVDMYVGLLTMLGIIESVKRGVRKKIFNSYLNISLGQARKYRELYKDLPGWFIVNEIEHERIKNDQKNKSLEKS